MDEARITELWRSGALRGVETQMLLWKAGVNEMGLGESSRLSIEESAPAFRTEAWHVPPCRIRQRKRRCAILRGQLENATGDRAVRLATKLQQVRRAVWHDMK